MDPAPPFAWWNIALANWNTAVRMGETLAAANTVIGSRVETMREAARDPLAGDYGELTRMVSEKVEAFTASGLSLARDIGAIQMEMATAMIQAARPPSMRRFNALSGRSARIAEHAAGAVGRALDPVHASATANARRLGKKRAR